MKPKLLAHRFDLVVSFAEMSWPEAFSLSLSHVQLAVAWYDFECDVPLRRQMMASSILHVFTYVCEKSLQRGLRASVLGLCTLLYVFSVFVNCAGLYMLFSCQRCDSVPYYLFLLGPLFQMTIFSIAVFMVAPAVVRIMDHYVQNPNLRFAVECVQSLMNWVGTHGMFAAPRWEIPGFVPAPAPLRFQVHPPRAPQIVYRLPTFALMETNEEDRCPICLDRMVMFDLVTTLRCRHQFHLECMQAAVRHNPCCPICRYPLEVHA